MFSTEDGKIFFLTKKKFLSKSLEDFSVQSEERIMKKIRDFYDFLMMETKPSVMNGGNIIS